MPSMSVRRPGRSRRPRRSGRQRSRPQRWPAPQAAAVPPTTCRSYRARTRRATNVVSVGAVPSLPPTKRIPVPAWAIVPSTRGSGEGQLGRRHLPRGDRADRRRTRQGLVLGRAEVDRTEGEDAQVDRSVDREVVRPVRDVAEHENDDDEPERRLDGRPGPAAGVEQPEERSAAGLCPSWLERLLRHRPPLRRTAASAAGDLLVGRQGPGHGRRDGPRTRSCKRPRRGLAPGMSASPVR